ncbi:hypothetical protein RhiirA1_405490 [Rhizophagus irregularis]|uniref:Uncharacterized protein n=1 Tax=Rhizophagus irregularis TaxID=588596 RepID=A0A2N0QKC6_9GLOM|nr:hypothetical protein RhiirA1_405490 [Rhizophagus irregularis]
MTHQNVSGWMQPSFADACPWNECWVCVPESLCRAVVPESCVVCASVRRAGRWAFSPSPLARIMQETWLSRDYEEFLFEPSCVAVCGILLCVCMRVVFVMCCAFSAGLLSATAEVFCADPSVSSQPVEDASLPPGTLSPLFRSRPCVA